MNVTSTRFTSYPPNKDLGLGDKPSPSTPSGPRESFTFGGQDYPPVSFGGAVPIFGAIMNGIGASDADPHGRTDLVHKSLAGAASNLAGTGALVAAFSKGSIPLGLVGLGLLGVSGFVAGHVFEQMP